MEWDSPLNDTSAEFLRIVTERHRQMTPESRMAAAASMFETARVIIESSLAPHLSRRDRRLAVARRFYAGELPEAALQAHAEWVGSGDPARAGSQ